jgi:hypothetical protein
MGAVTFFCKHGNEQSGSRKGGESFEQLSDYHILKENSTLFSNLYVYLFLLLGDIFLSSSKLSGSTECPHSVTLFFSERMKTTEISIEYFEKSFIIYSIIIIGETALSEPYPSLEDSSRLVCSIVN